VLYFRKLFDQGSEEILELSERKRGVGFVEINNEKKLRKLKIRPCSKFAGAFLGNCPQFSLKTLEIAHKGFNKS
jgi:hypothetical protein